MNMVDYVLLITLHRLHIKNQYASGWSDGKLDAIFFSSINSWGPGSSGVLIFDSSDVSQRRLPTIPAGGTVDWTNPWGSYKYVDDIEIKGRWRSPGFLQA